MLRYTLFRNSGRLVQSDTVYIPEGTNFIIFTPVPVFRSLPGKSWHGISD
jgi:hypothetical protein